MSLPTVYFVKDKDGKNLGRVQTKIWSWFPIVRSGHPEAFDTEVGELLATDVVPYCQGHQTGSPAPKFSLSDVFSMESSGGTVTRDEFPNCVALYAAQCGRIIDSLEQPRNTRQINTANIAEVIAAVASKDDEGDAEAIEHWRAARDHALTAQKILEDVVSASRGRSVPPPPAPAA